MITDFFRRKSIINDAKELVNMHFTTSEKRKLSNLKNQKAIKRIEALTNRLKADATKYKKEHNLGIYGTAKLAKEIQTSLEQEQLDEFLVKYPLLDIVYELKNDFKIETLSRGMSLSVLRFVSSI